MAKINPGELALASIGVDAVIRGDVPKQGLGRLRAMGDIPKQVVKLASKVADGSLKWTPNARSHDYATLLDRLSRALKPHELQELIALFPIEAADISTAFSIEVQQALGYLKSIFPLSTYQTFSGPKTMVPNDDAVYSFVNRLEVVNDPLLVFPLVSTGALLKTQAIAVRQVFPTLSQAIDEALYSAIAKKVAQSPVRDPYRIPQRVSNGIAVWLGRRVVDFQPPKPPPAAPAPTKTKKQAQRDDKETTTQKAEAV